MSNLMLEREQTSSADAVTSPAIASMAYDLEACTALMRVGPSHFLQPHGCCPHACERLRLRFTHFVA